MLLGKTIQNVIQSFEWRLSIMCHLTDHIASPSSACDLGDPVAPSSCGEF